MQMIKVEEVNNILKIFLYILLKMLYDKYITIIVTISNLSNKDINCKEEYHESMF